MADFASTYNKQITLSSGSAIIIPDIAGRSYVTVAAFPGAGCTVLVEYSISPSTPGTTQNWISWPAGGVVANTSDCFVGALQAIRLTRTVGANPCSVDISA